MVLLAEVTPFFGRQQEIEEVERRFAAGTRLVTLVGLGGIGKTRLAGAIAAREGRPILHVMLAEARTLEAAIREVARTARVELKAESRTRTAIEVVAKALAERGRLLVILDNLEQLGAAAGELADGLLGAAHELA